MGGGFTKNATPTSASAEVRHCGSKWSAAMGGGFAKNATLTSASAEVRHCGSKWSAVMDGCFTQSAIRIWACTGIQASFAGLRPCRSENRPLQGDFSLTVFQDCL